jgi:hypothetical protein
MPTALPPVAPKPSEIFQLARLSDEDLLLRAKADLLTSLAVDVLSVRDVSAAIGGLSRLVETIRVFREKTARAAASKLAPVVAGTFKDGGDDFCRRINYCARREALRETLSHVRKAVRAADVLNELFEIGELLASIVDALASLKLPLSVIFLIFLYTLDDVCKCDDESPLAGGRKLRRSVSKGDTGKAEWPDGRPGPRRG